MSRARKATPELPEGQAYGAYGDSPTQINRATFEASGRTLDIEASVDDAELNTAPPVIRPAPDTNRSDLTTTQEQIPGHRCHGARRILDTTSHSA